MTHVIDNLNGMARAWTALVWAVTWQSTLLVGICSLIARGLQRSSPSLRYWLWQIAAIKLLVMPLWGASILMPETPRRDTREYPESRRPARSADETIARPTDGLRAPRRDGAAYGHPRVERTGRLWVAQINWQTWLLAGWGLAVAWQAAAIARQRRLLNILLSRAVLVDNPTRLALVADLSDRIGLLRPPKVMIAIDVDSPFVCGLRRPTLVLPSILPLLLGPEQLRSVLLHELTHVVRRDLLWDWIPTIARLLYFFHPAAHYIAYRTRLERELACDQVAMVLTGLPTAVYATTLVNVVSRSSIPSALRPAASARLDGAEL